MVPKTMPPVPVFHRSLVNKARTTFAFRPIVLLLILIILLNVLPHNYHEIGIKYAKDIAGCDVDAPLNTMPVAEWSEITAIMNKEYSYFPKDQTSGVIYSLYLGNHTALLNSTGARNKRYAKRHGYAFLAIHDDLALMNALFEDLGSLDMRQLRKLQKYLIALALVSRYEWTLFIDADAGIYDCARTVESYFKWPAKLYISSYEKYPLFLNNGAIIFKRDAFTTSFLNKLLQRPKQPALYPMARHSKVISNLSEWDGYGTGTIADQKWVSLLSKPLY